MHNTTKRSYVRRNPNQNQTETGMVLLQMGAALMGGILLFASILFIFSAGYRLMYAGRIFPGVTVAGVDVSRMNPTDAAIELSTRLSYPYSGQIIFRDGDSTWLTTPAQLGLVFDPQASANAALKYGREINPFTSLNKQFNGLRNGAELAPQSMFDQRLAHAHLQNIGSQIYRPMQEARLEINGTEVVAAQGQIGRSLNVDASLALLNTQLAAFRDGEIPLVVTEQAPDVLNIQEQALQAQRLLAAPFTITLPDAQPGDPGPWQISPENLGPMLQVRKIQAESGATYQLELDRNKLRPVLEQIARQANRGEQNARFIFNDETRLLEVIAPSSRGREVDQETSIQNIEAAISRGESSASLHLNIIEPQVTDSSTGEELGIIENTITYTSHFRGSSASRMQNIRTAAAQFHGLLVAPGETFSMGAAMGDISLDSGYAEALIIFGGRTIQGVGGGVCQVSTALFRTAFFGGYPIPTRYAHAYRVSYYEQTASGIDRRLAGLDATVYFPLVDLKFTNDSPHWILMETYFSAASQTLTWKFYSTKDGRSVQWDTTGPRNVVSPPEPRLQQNPELGEFEFKQVDWAAEGADVTVNRTVMMGDKIHFVDKFDTYYQPWGAVCEYGAGVEDPREEAKKRNLCWSGQ
ncbi:MAG: VanW family protein [Anaerolineales bacterium]